MTDDSKRDRYRDDLAYIHDAGLRRRSPPRCRRG